MVHQIVNHSDGEITNAARYSTNAIEAKWSIVKRWIKKNHGGTMPTHNDRSKWEALFLEFQYRQSMGEPSPNDNGNTYEVPVKVFMKHVARQFGF